MKDTSLPVSLQVTFLIGACWLWCSLRAWAIDEILPPKAHEALPSPAFANDDWPCWRGVRGDGVAPEQGAPLTWSPKENIVWQTDVPGRGQASPIVVGSKIFLASADEQAEIQWLLAYDREDGRLLWKRELHRGGFMKDIHRKSTHAAATPLCDGSRVIVPLIHDKSLWVSATDLDGNILWQTKAGPYDAEYGFGSSPVLYQSLVIVLGDNDRTGAFMAALHRKTGEIVWRIRRPDVDTYATPIIARLADKDQLIIGGAGFTGSYNPENGQLLWKCDGPTAETTSNTAAFSDNRVYISGGYPTPYTLIAIRADGQGDVSATHTLWKVTTQMPYVPSPLYDAGRLFIIGDKGVASCLDAETGKSLWAKRLSGDFSASPVKSGNRIYAASESGTVYVFNAGPEYELLAKNELPERIFATPTICSGKIFLRTERTLYCLGTTSGR